MVLVFLVVAAIMRMFVVGIHIHVLQLHPAARSLSIPQQVGLCSNESPFAALTANVALKFTVSLRDMNFPEASCTRPVLCVDLPMLDYGRD